MSVESSSEKVSWTDRVDNSIALKVFLCLAITTGATAEWVRRACKNPAIEGQQATSRAEQYAAIAKLQAEAEESMGLETGTLYGEGGDKEAPYFPERSHAEQSERHWSNSIVISGVGTFICDVHLCPSGTCVTEGGTGVFSGTISFQPAGSKSTTVTADVHSIGAYDEGTCVGTYEVKAASGPEALKGFMTAAKAAVEANETDGDSAKREQAGPVEYAALITKADPATATTNPEGMGAGEAQRRILLEILRTISLNHIAAETKESADGSDKLVSAL
jgi:hypothetical protein